MEKKVNLRALDLTLDPYAGLSLGPSSISSEPDIGSLNLINTETLVPNVVTSIPTFDTSTKPILEQAFANYQASSDILNPTAGLTLGPDLTSLPTPGAPFTTDFTDKSIPSGDFWQNAVKVFSNIIKPSADVVANILTDMNKAELVSNITKSAMEAQKSAAAVAQAQVAAAKAAQQQQQNDIKALAQKAWANAAPYAIPIAVGLAIVSLLMMVGKTKSKQS